LPELQIAEREDDVGRYDGKIAVVTGAAQGIGRATALRLSGDGGTVMLADRAADECNAVWEEIVACGGHRDDEIEREISRSLWPTLWCCHAMVTQMIKQSHGAIVNVGSFATRGINRVPYSAAKGGVHAMTTSLSLELAPLGVRVNCVAPGGVDGGPRKIPRNPNPMSEAELGWRNEVTAQTLASTPLHRYGTLEEIAAAICFLGSDEASYITGQTLYVAGGGVG